MYILHDITPIWWFNIEQDHCEWSLPGRDSPEKEQREIPA